MQIDYHLHTNHSFDGTQSAEQLCMAAVSRGVDAIAITDHMDIYGGKPYSAILDCGACFADIQRVRAKYGKLLSIACGIELGQPMRNPPEAEAFLRDWPLDFIIGSVHNLEDDTDVGTYDFSKVSFDKVFTRYLDCLLDFAENYEYDVLGHVTYPMRYFFLQTGSCPDPMRWKEQFEKIFAAVIDRGRGIEFNTSSLARGKGILLPGEDLLALYRDMGGTIITTGSDAHVACETGITSVRAVQKLKQLGFQYITTYQNRNPIQNRI